jgi:hypothetical protein
MTGSSTRTGSSSRGSTVSDAWSSAVRSRYGYCRATGSRSTRLIHLRLLHVARTDGERHHAKCSRVAVTCLGGWARGTGRCLSNAWSRCGRIGARICTRVESAESSSITRRPRSRRVCGSGWRRPVASWSRGRRRMIRTGLWACSAATSWWRCSALVRALGHGFISTSTPMTSRPRCNASKRWAPGGCRASTMAGPGGLVFCVIPPHTSVLLARAVHTRVKFVQVRIGEKVAGSWRPRPLRGRDTKSHKPVPGRGLAGERARVFGAPFDEHDGGVVGESVGVFGE